MWWFLMNKKGFLAGDVMVYIVSIAVLAVVALLFFGLFSYLKITQPEKPSSTEISSPKISVYEYLDYYLNTKIRIDEKETSLIELIPLYCFTLDEKTGSYVKKLSSYLLPVEIGVSIGCSLNECKEILDQGTIRNPTLIDLPSFSPKAHSCLLIETTNYKTDKLIESIYSSRIFEEKVKEPKLKLISPAK